MQQVFRLAGIAGDKRKSEDLPRLLVTSPAALRLALEGVYHEHQLKD